MALLSEYGFTAGSGTVSADSSGNGYDLTASNSSTSWDANGKNGPGAKLEHTGNMGPNTSQSDFTIMAWVKRTGTWSGWAGYVANDTQSLYFEAQAADGYIVSCYTGTDGAAGTTALELDTWTHVAVTQTGGTSQIYVNGAAEGSTGIGNPAHNFGSDNNWVIAGTAATAGENADFVGIVDEVRVFDTALNAATITTWMNTPVGSSSDTGLAWIKA